MKFKSTSIDNLEILYSEKKALGNGKALQFVELYDNAPIEPIKECGIIINEEPREPKKAIGIFLTENDKYLGNVSATIFIDGNAQMNYFALAKISNYKDVLPHNLEKIIEEIKTDPRRECVAIHGRGYGRLLIKTMMEYLAKERVKNLEVNGVINKKAMSFYKNTGAEKINDYNAIYRKTKTKVRDLLTPREKRAYRKNQKLNHNKKKANKVLRKR